MIKSPRRRPRTVVDRAREPWVVEQVGPAREDRVLVRFRHELGYELVALAPGPVVVLTDGRLVQLLEEAKGRVPGESAPAA
jgi:hypothetical protein